MQVVAQTNSANINKNSHIQSRSHPSKFGGASLAATIMMQNGNKWHPLTVGCFEFVLMRLHKMRKWMDGVLMTKMTHWSPTFA